MKKQHNSGPYKQKSLKQTTIKVTENSPLMNFLQNHFPHQSRTTIKSILVHRQVSIDGRIITRHDHQLQPGQTVTVNWSRAPEEIRYPGLKIIFEDKYLIVIEKEAGMLSIATDKETMKTAYSILSSHVKKNGQKNKIFVVHRLDRETSGIMIFAKNQEVQQKLQERWSETIMERTYVAVAEGSFEKDKGTIINYLYESKALKMYITPDTALGQKAVTHFRVMMKNDSYTLLEINLETGRKNQIRVHMQELGHSIIGDKKYGSTVNPVRRLGLHALIISFIHPESGKIMRFETPVPSIFLKLFRNPKKNPKTTNPDFL
ncbi:MAG: RluA family pseudouridine synthase [Bacteroidales bacterium]|nr:RluA family pseudouridine synthase [Bacteroidales bacterium]